MKNANKPITPLYVTGIPVEEDDLRFCKSEMLTGLTKREYFAGLAMQGFACDARHPFKTTEDMAEWPVKWSDALLAELEKDND